MSFKKIHLWLLIVLTAISIGFGLFKQVRIAVGFLTQNRFQQTDPRRDPLELYYQAQYEAAPHALRHQDQRSNG